MDISKEFDPNITHPFYFIRKGIIEAIKENASYMTGIMMDFGCGSKPYQSVFSNVKKYIGVDYQGEGHKHDNENIDVFYDGKIIPFENNYFDSILCSEVFEHLFEIDTILDEFFRVIKPKGKLLITCPFVWNEHEVPVDYFRYTQYGLKGLLEKHGFKIIRSGKKGTFIEALAQLRTLYVLETYFGKYNLHFYTPRRFTSMIKKLYIFLNNLFGITANVLFPKRYDIYLSNIFVVEKLTLINEEK